MIDPFTAATPHYREATRPGLNVNDGRNGAFQVSERPHAVGFTGWLIIASVAVIAAVMLAKHMGVMS